MSNNYKQIANGVFKKIRLGDKIEAVADATGISTVVKLVEKVTGKPCGCKERKRRLNGESSVDIPPKKIPDSHKDIHEDDGTNEGMDEPPVKLKLNF